MIRIIAHKFFGTIKQFKMPDLGEKIKEATVVKWHVKEGDSIQEFDPVADVSTDKMFTQIPSSFNGKIHKRFHNEQDVCQVGELFLEIETDEQSSATQQQQKAIEKKQEKQQEKPQEKQQQKQQEEKQQLQRLSPAARYLAHQYNIDIQNIVGTGRKGTITKQDVLDIQSKPQSITTSYQESQTIKMTDFQKGMQKSMTESLKIPHLYLSEDVDITHLHSFRQNIKQSQNITFMTLFIKSFSLALHKFPILNSTYNISEPFQYTTHKDHNISLALDSPKGLVVPNIKKVQDLSIPQVQEELNKLKNLGEQGRLSANELGGGTICLSNIGTIGGTYVGPLILSPQICIVGIGKVILQPRFLGGSYVPRRILNISFGCDHRILDGATVTRFSNEWKEYLENPDKMVLNMK